MTPWSQDYVCPDGHRFNLIIEKDTRHSPVECEVEGCTKLAGPTFSVPKNLRATYPDGTRRGGIRQLAEAAEIEADSFNLPVEKRGEHQKAIKDLTKAKT